MKELLEKSKPTTKETEERKVQIKIGTVHGFIMRLLVNLVKQENESHFGLSGDSQSANWSEFIKNGTRKKVTIE